MKKIIYVLILSMILANTAFSKTNKMEKEEKLLPLGSVVRLRNAKEDKKLLIIGRTPITTENGIEGYYDYMGAPHVIGLVKNTYFFFNHEDIEKILFKGYVNELELEYQKGYKEKIKSTSYPKFKNN